MGEWVGLEQSSEKTNKQTNKGLALHLHEGSNAYLYIEL